MTYLLGGSKVSHYHCVEVFIFFQVLQNMLDEVGCMTVCAYRLIIVIFFWRISPFVSMEYHSLSHLMNVSLKSTLSEISIATPACFRGSLAW
jgi:hypothetical protein